MIWDFLLYLWLLSPIVISMILLAWIFGMLAVLFYSSDWLYRITDFHIPGSKRSRRERLSFPLPRPKPAPEPTPEPTPETDPVKRVAEDAAVLSLEEYRRAS